jgi:hypothetical protein
MFDYDSQCRQADTWDDKLDGRGQTYRIEFIDELHKTLADNIDLIKTNQAKIHDDL